MRYGSLEMDNVELFQLSQADTEKAALRFEKVPLSSSTVTNCAIHNGEGWGLSIEESQNIVLRGNHIFRFAPIGLAIRTSNLITLDGNVVAHITARATFTAQMLLDTAGGYSICALGWVEECNGRDRKSVV